MIDKIKDLDTSIVVFTIVVTVGILAGFEKVEDTTLMFFTNVVAYILGEKVGKAKV